MEHIISPGPLMFSAASGFGCLVEGSKAFKAGIGSAEMQSPPDEQLCF